MMTNTWSVVYMYQIKINNFSEADQENLKKLIQMTPVLSLYYSVSGQQTSPQKL